MERDSRRTRPVVPCCPNQIRRPQSAHKMRQSRRRLGAAFFTARPISRPDRRATNHSSVDHTHHSAVAVSLTPRNGDADRQQRQSEGERSCHGHYGHCRSDMAIAARVGVLVPRVGVRCTRLTVLPPADCPRPLAQGRLGSRTLSLTSGTWHPAWSTVTVCGALEPAEPCRSLLPMQHRRC